MIEKDKTKNMNNTKNEKLNHPSHQIENTNCLNLKWENKSSNNLSKFSL